MNIVLNVTVTASVERVTNSTLAELTALVERELRVRTGLSEGRIRGGYWGKEEIPFASTSFREPNQPLSFASIEVQAAFFDEAT